MNYLDIKHLRMLCAIAETGNMTRAAENLFITQSALSQQLKDIETKLGIILFHRTRKKMMLTPAGNKLFESSKQIIEKLEDAELEIKKIVSGDKGELKVGTECIFCYKWLPKVLVAFKDKFPNIEFTIGNSHNIAEDLSSGKYDFVISGSPFTKGNLQQLVLFKDQWVCIMPSNHPFSTKSHIDLEDYNQTNLISHETIESDLFYKHLLEPINIKPKQFMMVGQSQAIIEMVASGFGLANFPLWAVKSYLINKKIVARPITQKGLPLTWNAFFLKDSEINIFQKKFIDIVSKFDVPGTHENGTEM